MAAAGSFGTERSETYEEVERKDGVEFRGTRGVGSIHLLVGWEDLEATRGENDRERDPEATIR